MLLFAIESGSVDLLSNYCCIFGEISFKWHPNTHETLKTAGMSLDRKSQSAGRQGPGLRGENEDALGRGPGRLLPQCRIITLRRYP
jgi:hypothetical protein